MKRILLYAALAVAIVSIGGNTLSAHAQTLTPAQAAAIQQQLDVAKAELANLEMAANAVPPADAGTPSVVPAATVVTAPVTSASSLTPEQVSAFQATLNTLAQTLVQLNASLAANTNLSVAQQQAVQNTLNGMKGTLVAMANTIEGANGSANMTAPASAPVAVETPSAPVAANTAPSMSDSETQVSANVAPSTDNAAAASPAPAETQTAAPQVAQASSLWSFTKAHWPTIVIVLLVIAILAILFWPEKDPSVKTVAPQSGKPKSAPTPSVNVSQSVATPAQHPTQSAPAPATPVANAVVAHQK